MVRLVRLGAFLIVVLCLGLGTWELVPEERVLVLPDKAGAAASASHRALGYFPRLYVAYATEDGRIFGIEDHFLYMSEDGGSSFRRLGSLPRAKPGFFAWAKDRVARSKLARLIRRNFGPSNVVVLKSGTILVFWDRIYRSADGGASFEPVFDFDAEGIVPPFGLSEGVAVGPDDLVYFGEYNASRGALESRILRGEDDGRSWKVVHTFPAGEIRHVHSIQYDPYRDRYWICTGDSDSQSRLLYTEDDFQSLQLLGGGSQDWRAVSLMITEENLHWGSDNDTDGSSIFRWSFKDQELQKLEDIGKVSYFSTVLSDGTLVLSTTYEPNSPYTRDAKPAASTDIWVSRDGQSWEQILSLPYENTGDETRMSRAAVGFPGGHPLDRLFFTPVSTAEGDFTTQVIRISR